MPRTLTSNEVNTLLATTAPIHLASIDSHGYPHITPTWFEWDGLAFWMTSLPNKPHVRRLRGNDAASVCLDIELVERPDGERPNRQLRALGRAELVDDVGGDRTRSITYRYLTGAGREAMAAKRTSSPRVAIRLAPSRMVAIASV